MQNTQNTSVAVGNIWASISLLWSRVMMETITSSHRKKTIELFIVSPLVTSYSMSLIYPWRKPYIGLMVTNDHCGTEADQNESHPRIIHPIYNSPTGSCLHITAAQIVKDGLTRCVMRCLCSNGWRFCSIALILGPLRILSTFVLIWKFHLTRIECL